MICESCKTAGEYGHSASEHLQRQAEKLHEKCESPGSCTCQHRKTKRMPDGTLADMTGVQEGRMIDK